MDLKAARAKKGITQSELSRLTDISTVSLSRYEQGHSVPSPITRKRIESVIGPVEWTCDQLPLTQAEFDLIGAGLVQFAKNLNSFEQALELFTEKKPNDLRLLARSILATQQKLCPNEVN